MLAILARGNSIYAVIETYMRLVAMAVKSLAGR